MQIASQKKEPQSILFRWGRWSAAHHKRVLVTWLLLLVAAASLIPHFVSSLGSTTSLSVRGSDSARAARVLRSEFPQLSAEHDLVVFSSDSLRSGDPGFEQVVKQTLTRPPRRQARHQRRLALRRRRPRDLARPFNRNRLTAARRRAVGAPERGRQPADASRPAADAPGADLPHRHVADQRGGDQALGVRPRARRDRRGDPGERHPAARAADDRGRGRARLARHRRPDLRLRPSRCDQLPLPLRRNGRGRLDDARAGPRHRLFALPRHAFPRGAS